MALRFLHTADLQIGRAFAFAPPDRAALLAEARIEALDRLAAAARAAGAPRVLIAGDLFDAEHLAERTLERALAAMRRAEDLTWHVIPGNHDPDRPGGLWERIGRRGLPANVRVHRTAAPVALETTDDEPPAWLLPAPLSHKRALGDPTAWMDQAPTPEGALRIGLAHGSVAGFGAEDGTESNPIAPDRPGRAGLAWLALGDWHGRRRIGPRAWYPGTPEPDRFRLDPEGDGTLCVGGFALAVTIAGEGTLPEVTPVATGRFLWRLAEPCLAEVADVERFLETALAWPQLEDTVLRLAPSGALPLAGRERFALAIEQDLAARLRWLDLDLSALSLRPDEAELGLIDLEGVVRIAADRLAARARDPADPEAETARRALLELWLLRDLAKP